jgi:hypothetical protein
MEATNRRRFLRQLGTTLAAGMGIAWLPSQRAYAVNCCPDPTCGSCPSGKRKFRCQCPDGSYCTICLTRTTCYNGPC